MPHGGQNKPPHWALEPGLVDPKWGWFFRDLKIFHPTWEGGGAPRDVIGQNHGILGSTAPVWQGERAGLTLKYDDTVDQENNWYTVADAPDLTHPAGNWTLAWYMRVPDNTGAAFQYWHSWGGFAANPSVNVYIEEASGSNPGALHSVLVSGGLTLRAQSVNTVAPFTDYKLVVLRKFAVNESRFYVDGVDVHSSYTSQSNLAEIDLSSALNIGRRSDAETARYFGGEISWWAKWDRDIGEAAILQLDRDPFGPMHIDQRAIWLPPAAVAVPTIHLTMPPYIPA